jgi:hypothetical protein
MQTLADTVPIPGLEGTRRSRAEAEVKAAQVDTAAGQDAVSRLSAELTAERNTRARLVEQFDSAAQRGEEQTARELQAQLQACDIKLRGAELRLESASQELKECQEIEARLSEDLARLLNEEALEAEGIEVQQMIAAAKGAYDETVRAAERFEASLLALKEKVWLDPRHKSEASTAVFKLAARCKGFNY